MADASSRSTKLSAYFFQVVNGRRGMKNSSDGDRFLEALCGGAEVSKRVEDIIAAKMGLDSIAQAFRFSTSTPFLNGAATDAILYLAHPSLKQLCRGQFLLRVLESIATPPTFLNAFVAAHEGRNLIDKANHAFAWLLFELVASHSEELPNVRAVAERVTQRGSLVNSPSLEVRKFGHKIKHVLNTTSTKTSEGGAGGRHDNDFLDFRQVKILPTPDEFASTETPFYRRAESVDSLPVETRASAHLDNQFRLNREDIVAELRSDFQIATGQKKGSARKNFIVPDLALEGVDCGDPLRRKFCTVRLICRGGIPQLPKEGTVNERLSFVKANKNFVRHQSFGCLISEGNVVAFATVERDEDLLAIFPPMLVLRIEDEDAFSKTLLVAKSSPDLRFVQVNTAVFAYKPILRCLQKITELPLQDQIIDLQSESAAACANVVPPSILSRIRQDSRKDLQQTLQLAKPVQLDDSQAESLDVALARKVALIQGPPGTGKSFIGALYAKTIHDFTNEKILVICYTNHALDQFLEDLIDIGIDQSSIVRLGSKSSPRTEPLALRKQQGTYKLTKSTWEIIEDLKAEAEGYAETLMSRMARYRNLTVSKSNLLDYLEFSDDSDFFYAFIVPKAEDGMKIAGYKGRAVDRYYLLDRWTKCRDPGVFRDATAQEHHKVWRLDRERRIALLNRWVIEVLRDSVSEIGVLMKKYDQCKERLDVIFREKDAQIIREKRVIGCTTTAAAMKADEIHNAAPGIILVEEAGEILESHVLTAMTPNTKQLVLIGDHKQLRPKCNNYDLTVEKGDGYNLNMSMFERLVRSGIPHTTLKSQHRMRPEISSFVRKLTYPELEDAPSTSNRPSLKGFRNNVVFISHDHVELNADQIAERRDGNARSSYENVYEVDMILRLIRYLGQQGYGTDRIVILTPYLGQLFLLRNKLTKEQNTDPILNDLDSWDLIRAGLLSPAAAQISKRSIKISTIDNYQGEESDIVIVSLTRSNKKGEIGFMAAPQRVNVLLSRARNGLIMIGNPETFMNSRKGKDVWIPLMEQLKEGGHIYDGVPVKCERHPNKTALLRTKEDFDLLCPDGGCAEPCGTLLRCGAHACPHRCHNLHDHSRMECEALIFTTCSKGHKFSRKCHDKNGLICGKCEAETRRQEQKRKRDHKLDQERAAKQKRYAEELAEVQAEIDHQRRLHKDDMDDQERQNVLAQHRQDLANLKARQKIKTTDVKSSQTPSVEHHQPQPNTESPEPRSKQLNPENKSNSSPERLKNTAGSPNNQCLNKSPDQSESRDDWEYQKEFEGQANEALDKLMTMIGLESVKKKFLDIKAKIDTLVRQNVPLKGERYGAALLGNPGTGKTTVARLYGQFLVKVGALPGDRFVETSGSSLANDGVNAAKKHIEELLNSGGGVYFIDEAYQLSNGNSYGGKAVLDYLLAEMENLVGKVVFVIAGYNKQMETFMAHNPGIPSRIPITLDFKDYEDEELLSILRHTINTKYKGTMKAEGGLDGLFLRIVARRIGRGRGREGFGNAREVQNTFARITERQARRLRTQRRKHEKPDDKLLTKEDLIGPEPSSALKNNTPWSKLQKLIGLKAVKQSVQVLLDGIQYNYQRELDEKPLVQYSLNRCFIGSPGTGKTSVAKLYGQILADIGLLSNGEVVVKNPADFVGNVLGQSENNTKAILAATVGKVLLIDEAYMLCSGSGGAGSSTDSFKSAVIDTIVAEVQSTPGEDRCVLLLGYVDEMENMFRDVNPGLARRFPLDSAFVFEDFDDSELRQILDLKLDNQGFDATDQAKHVAMDMLRRARNRPHFGNAGEVDILLDKAKMLHQKHMSCGQSKHPDKFEAIDFDPDFDRVARAATNLPMLFRDVIGCEQIVKQLQGYQSTVAKMKALDMDPKGQIPFNFLFKGPSGTGKTTTARRMGKVYYDMGFLADTSVEECSATDLVGQYVGHTGPKVQKALEKALGKILFIDEAYRLSEGQFAKEAMDELVDCLTKPKYAGKMVVILAGYDDDINRLMTINPGLTSRFPETISFRSLTPEECLKLLTGTLKKKTIKAPMDLSVLDSPSESFRDRILALFAELSVLKSWGNARDVQSLEKTMFKMMLNAGSSPITSLLLTEDNVESTLEAMLSERLMRHKAAGTSRGGPQVPKLPIAPSQPQDQKPPQISTKTEVNSLTNSKSPATVSTKPTVEQIPAKAPNSTLNRDPGVSDEIWQQLQEDKIAAEKHDHDCRRLEQDNLRKQEEEKQDAEELAAELERLQEAEKQAADDEERRRAEQERIQRELERREIEMQLAELERQRQKILEERKKEQRAQQKLRELGVCVMGYKWIKQASGYRCSAGGHFVTNEQLGV